MPSESRSVKRRERYRELRALGFNATDARRLRDRSGKNISLAISIERRRISRKPQQLRSSEEVFRLRRIQARSKRSDQIFKQSRFDSRRERWLNFSEWSKARAFPPQFKARIRQINDRAGMESPEDGYGYRRFYYEYVERLSIEDSIQLADRGDSGVKYLLPGSRSELVPGRTNLRREINPPKSQSEVA